ncbi:MAG: tetratricopeptide repeat protein, partial [bacterium]|nr:tetratricopeptide repeat protein [bacterium]
MKIPHTEELIPIAAAAVHYRGVKPAAGDFLHVVAVQHGIDLEVRLKNANGETIWWVNSPNGTRGPEELLVIIPATAAAEDSYRIEVAASADAAASGHYTFKVAGPRPATDADRELVEADHAFHRGYRLGTKGKYPEALELFHRALPVWQRRALPHREGDTLFTICQAHRGLGHARLALAFCDRAVELYRATEDRWMMAFALDHAGFLRLRLGQTTRAVDHLEEGLSLYEEFGYERGVVLCLARLGTGYHQRGELRRAVGCLESARHRSGSEPSSSRATILVDLADAMLALNRLEEAEASYREALAFYREQEPGSGLVAALDGLANAAARRQRYDEAEEALAEARTVLEKLASARLRAAIAGTRGRLRRLQGRLDLARPLFEEALRHVREAEDPQGEGYFLLELGHVLVRQGDPQEGLEHIERAIAVFTQLENRLDLASARARSAEALRDLGKLDDARERIELALHDVENVRAGTRRQDVRTGYFAFRQEYYEVAIDVLLRSGSPREAFEIHERRLARELRETLVDAPVAQRRPDPALEAEERALEQQIRELAVRTPASELAANQELRQALGELHRVWGEMDERAPEDPGSVAAPERSRIVGIREARERLLDDGSLLLVYALGEE